MNKAQLVDAMAAKTGVSKVSAKKCVDAFIEVISTSLRDGEKVTLSGFGSFVVERKQPRMGRDPRNGAPIKIAAKNVAKFRPGVELCDKLR